METTMPAWIGPTVAIALVVIALAFAAIGVAVALLARTTIREVRELREEVAPAISAVRRITDAGADLSGDIRQEVQEYLATSRAVRRDLERGVYQVKSRLADLDALYEVVHEEVEDTALDVAARVRAVRNGAGMVSRIRRWLVRGRR
jgi:methyl-accepting chemotaxis protein